MHHDKKVSNQQLVFILLDAVGRVAIDKTITAEKVESFLNANLS